MNNYKFSVSMCVYGKDNPGWFKTAVDSILNQTLKPDEVVLVVDGPVPEDLSSVILECEQHPLFKVIRLEENQGHGNARRTGLHNCTYEIVALMDADDISTLDRFEKQINVFKGDNELDIVGGNITEFIDEPNNIVGKRVVPIDNATISEYIKTRCPMNQVTVMFKKASVDLVGGFVDWYCEEDYYLWLRMYLANMKFANVSDVLVNVRVGKDMYQRRGGLKYYRSEAKLQKYMLDNKVVSLPLYISNITKRFIIQVLIPNRVRGWVFQKFAREKA